MPESGLQIALTLVTGLGTCVWLMNLLLMVQCVRHIPLLSDLAPRTPQTWPRVSVVIPACNEAHTVEAALRSHLATDYPHIELLPVDDRSHDGTGTIIDRLATEDARIRPVHITELPEGWLGKVHALHTGTQQATGDWLLFADADTHVRPDALARIIAWCEHEHVDLFSPIFRLLGGSNALVDLAVSTFARLMFIASQPWRVSDPKAKQAFGAGAFILVRRSAFERTEGFAWLRMEVADDMALALLLKRSGARLRVVNARDHIELALYTTPDEVRRSTEKGGYAILGHYSLAKTLGMAVLLPALELAPLAGFVPVGVSWLPALGAIGTALMLACLTWSMRWFGRPAWTAIAYPVGMLWMSWLNVRSGFIGARQQGIRWRDTFYPAEMLRAGIRVHWP